MLLLIATVVIFTCLAYYMPKRLTPIEMYVSALFASYFACQVDVYLNLKYNLYGYFQPGPDFEALLVILGVYPAYSIIYLNYFPFQKDIPRQMVYILAHSLFAVGYEWLSTTPIGFFYHSGWKLWYSLILYPFLLLVLTLQLVFVRKLKIGYKPNRP